MRRGHSVTVIYGKETSGYCSHYYDRHRTILVNPLEDSVFPFHECKFLQYLGDDEEPVGVSGVFHDQGLVAVLLDPTHVRDLLQRIFRPRREQTHAAVGSAKFKIHS